MAAGKVSGAGSARHRCEPPAASVPVGVSDDQAGRFKDGVRAHVCALVHGCPYRPSLCDGAVLPATESGHGPAPPTDTEADGPASPADTETGEPGIHNRAGRRDEQDD